ncbi:uncharacterized protein CFAP97D2 [Eucyclogobius newberryi]|uniref:uncharacterized protein CFAP97D2 n=1 Tax=Eucyclogobius newberryi TaxID=166745 RepID=UPI003B5C556E
MAQYQVYQFPAGNKYLQQKWDKAFYDLHRYNVKTAKPTINITTPETYGHLALKLRKQKMDQDRNTQIQRENNLLLEKIAHIMQTTGTVDNLNFYEKKSLNVQQRQMELLHISHENQLMQQRLSQCKSHYNVKSWHQDWIKTMGLMNSISRYPRRAHTKVLYFNYHFPS